MVVNLLATPFQYEVAALNQVETATRHPSICYFGFFQEILCSVEPESATSVLIAVLIAFSPVVVQFTPSNVPLGTPCCFGRSPTRSQSFPPIWQQGCKVDAKMPSVRSRCRARSCGRRENCKSSVLPRLSGARTSDRTTRNRRSGLFIAPLSW